MGRVPVLWGGWPASRMGCGIVGWPTCDPERPIVACLV